jgi:multidrug efflux pump subunit AcrB
VVDQPEILLDVDRVKASQLGLTQRDVTSSMLISLSGNGSVAPNFWVNWANGVNYNVGVQTPQYRINSLDALLRTPISVATNAITTWTPDSQAGAAGTGNASVGASPSGSSQAYGNPGAMTGSTQLLSNLATARRSYAPVIVNHYNVWPVFDVYANVDRSDLGGVGGEVEKIMREEEPHLPRGASFALRGQIETMQSSFFRLGLGMVFAVVLVYLLMTVNFQSWLDPFIILMALPGALAGILWMLFVTGTTLSVPALTGAIMTMGVATANSILLVAFARERLAAGIPPLSAALEAGATRIRPVLMTALAMIIGMIPMALGLGEGAEQNAPLGRAVIGGLLFATVSTLFFVPAVYAEIHSRRAHRLAARDAAAAPHSLGAAPQET